MPNREEHSKHSLERYGVEGRDIHRWMDEPVRKYTGRHRDFRHDKKTIKFIGQFFGVKYGRTMAENIALDHLLLDHKSAIDRRNEIIEPKTERDRIFEYCFLNSLYMTYKLLIKGLETQKVKKFSEELPKLLEKILKWRK